MTSSIIIEVLIIITLLLGNGLLAMAEIAVITSRKARLERLLEEGDQRAEVVLELQSKPNDFLSTVQTGITMSRPGLNHVHRSPPFSLLHAVNLAHGGKYGLT